MKKKIMLSVVIIIVIAAFILIKTKDQGVSTKVEKEDLGIATQVVEVSEGNIVKEITYIGTIDVDRTTHISSSMTTNVMAVNVREGDYVNEGDVIGVLDDNNIANSLETMRVKIETLKENYNYLNAEVKDYYLESAITKQIENLEYESTYANQEMEKINALYTEGISTKSDLDQMVYKSDLIKLQLAELKASAADQYDQLIHERDTVLRQIKELETELDSTTDLVDDTILTAPMSGIIRKVYYEVGDLALASKVFATIDSASGFLVRVNVSESDLKKLSKETRTYATISDDKMEVLISKLPTSISSASRIGQVEIILPEDDREYIIGSSLEIAFILDEVKSAITLPIEAVKSQGEIDYVYVIEEGVVRKQIVELGLEASGYIQVMTGLISGETVAIENLNKLHEGAKVFIFKGVE